MGKKKGGKLDPPFEAADTDDVETLTALLDAGDKAAMVAMRNRDGWSLLHQAAYAGASDCVELLIKSGADVGSKCRDGDTPVHYASAQGHIEIITALVRAGGKRLLDLKDNDHETPLDVAFNAKVKRAIEALADAEEDEDDDGEEDGEDDEKLEG